jgi:hypothetical protein
LVLILDSFVEGEIGRKIIKLKTLGAAAP